MKRLPSPLSLLMASMGLNLVLAVGMVWSWCRAPEVKIVSVSTPANRATSAPQKASMRFSQRPPFQWKELESPDFATFIKNLRSIGCPEPTIRDIVSGELTEIYEQKLQGLTSNSSGETGSVAELRSRLKEEQNQLMGTLLAASPSQASAPAKTDASNAQAVQAAASTGAGTHPTSAMIPAAFMVGNAANQDNHAEVLSATVSDTTLTPTTAAALNQLRSDFASSMQSADTATPESAAYRQRWRQSMIQSNEQFSKLYGGEAFVRTQIQGVQTSLGAKTGP